jgi:hypothetical protein
MLADTLFQLLAQLVDSKPAVPPCLCRHALSLSSGTDEIELYDTGIMLENSQLCLTVRTSLPRLYRASANDPQTTRKCSGTRAGPAQPGNFVMIGFPTITGKTQ